MNVRLLAVDLDGTLLTSERQIHPRSRRAIRRAIDSGVKVVLASGRIAPSMLPFAQELGIERPMICSNGAHVIGEDGDDLHHFEVDAETRDAVLAYAIEQDVHLNIYCRHDLFFLKDSFWGDFYISRVKTIRPRYISVEEVRNLEPTKMMLVASPEEIAGHAKNLEQVVRFGARMTLSEPEYLEFLSVKADKAAGLQALAESMSIDQSEVAAIGDYLNDLEMLSWANVVGTVANADIAVKTVASNVFSSNDEGGVADFVDSLVLNGRE